MSDKIKKEMIDAWIQDHPHIFDALVKDLIETSPQGPDGEDVVTESLAQASVMDSFMRIGPEAVFMEAMQS